MTDDIELQPHIDKLDRLLATATKFEEAVLRENRGMIFTATFEVFLTDDLNISAGASVDADGELIRVDAYLYEDYGTNEEARLISSLPVEPSNGPWSAMAI